MTQGTNITTYFLQWQNKRLISIAGEALVDCSIYSYGAGNNPLYRCLVRKPYPLKRNDKLSFSLLFPLDNHIHLGEFSADFTLKTAEEDRVHVSEALRIKIMVDYTIEVEG